MRTILSFIALTVITFAMAVISAGNSFAAAGAANDVYLPIMSSQTPTGPINVYYLQSDGGGAFNVPLTGGGQQQFVVQDYFDRPLGGINVTAIENQDGVTLIAAGEGAGYTDIYHPFLASFGPAPGALEHYQLKPDAPINITMTGITQSERYGEGNGLIMEHLLILPDYAPGWQEDTGDIEEYCDVAADDDSWGAIVGHSIQGVAAPASGLQFHVNFDVYGGPEGGSTAQECENLLAGPGEFNQRIISNPGMGAYIFAADASVGNTNGVVYGQITDDGSGFTVSGANITLSGLLDNRGAVAETESFPNGWYRLEGVAAGDYLVEIARPGYAPETANVSVGPGGAANAGDTPMVLTDPAFLTMYNNSDGVLTFWIFLYGLEVVQDTIPSYETGNYELAPGDYHFVVSISLCPAPGEGYTTLDPGETENWQAYCLLEPQGGPARTAISD